MKKNVFLKAGILLLSLLLLPGLSGCGAVSSLIATPTPTMTPTPEPTRAEIVGIVVKATFKGNKIDQLAYGGKLVLLLESGEKIEIDYPQQMLSDIKGCPKFNTDRISISAPIVAIATIGIEEHQKVLLIRNASQEWEILEVLK